MTAKTIEWGTFGKLVPGNILQNSLYVKNLGNWYTYFYGCFFFIRFTCCSILYNMWNTWVSHSISMAWENAVKSIELGEPRKLVPIFSLTYGYFSSIRFPFYGILCYHMGNAWFFPSKSTLWPLWLFFYSIIFCVSSKIYWFPKRQNRKNQ